MCRMGFALTRAAACARGAHRRCLSQLALLARVAVVPHAHPRRRLGVWRLHARPSRRSALRHHSHRRRGAALLLRPRRPVRDHVSARARAAHARDTRLCEKRRGCHAGSSFSAAGAASAHPTPCSDAAAHSSSSAAAASGRISGGGARAASARDSAAEGLVSQAHPSPLALALHCSPALAVELSHGLRGQPRGTSPRRRAAAAAAAGERRATPARQARAAGGLGGGQELHRHALRARKLRRRQQGHRRRSLCVCSCSAASPRRARSGRAPQFSRRWWRARTAPPPSLRFGTRTRRAVRGGTPCETPPRRSR